MKDTIEEIFKNQLNGQFNRIPLSFIVVDKFNAERLVSWKKKDIDQLLEQYEFVKHGDKKFPLPRFKEK